MSNQCVICNKIRSTPWVEALRIALQLLFFFFFEINFREVGKLKVTLCLR